MHIIESEYASEHGRPPAGEGNWSFTLVYDDDSSTWVQLAGEYTAVVERARQMADDGLTEIIVMP